MFGLKKLEKKLVRRLKALILLIITSGVGVGGYANRDHPVMQKLLSYLGAKIAEQPDAPGESKIERAVLGALVDEFDPFHKPGEFEISIEKITLDDKEFRAGHEVDLEVRIVKYDAQGGKGLVIGDIKDTGRQKTAGKGPISVSWPDHPFKVEWNAGDEFDIEIWDRQGFRPTKKFVLETEEDGSFPLRTKTFTLTTDAEGKALRDPTENLIVLKSRRLSTPDAKEPDAISERSANRSSTRR